MCTLRTAIASAIAAGFSISAVAQAPATKQLKI